jgi:hypothetical protein
VGVSPRSPAGVHTLVEGLNTHSNVAHLTFVSASIGDPRRGRHRVDPGCLGRSAIFSGARPWENWCGDRRGGRGARSP